MDNVITRSKFVNETISIVLDFYDQLQTGETISSVTITVTLFTGTDSDPSNILFQLPSITGTVVDQKFRLGVPGTIYEVVYLVTGSLGTKGAKSTNLAILPQDGTAIPSYTWIFETSLLYPYELFDSFIGGHIITSGRFFNALYAIPPEGISTSHNILSGTLVGSGVSYAIPPEAIQAEHLIVSGVLVVVTNPVNYAIPEEAITSNHAIISGTLVGQGIMYTIPFESILGQHQITSGTLA